MKLELLFTLLLLNSISHAQSTVNNFFSTKCTKKETDKPRGNIIQGQNALHSPLHSLI